MNFRHIPIVNFFAVNAGVSYWRWFLAHYYTLLSYNIFRSITMNTGQVQGWGTDDGWGNSSMTQK